MDGCLLHFYSDKNLWPPMRLAVLADTHGHARFTADALRTLETYAPDALLHCGDVGNASLVPTFLAAPCAAERVHFVFGNVDTDRAGQRLAMRDCGFACHDEFADLTLGDTRVALLHGDDRRRLRAAIDCGEYDLVCHGHTHVKRWERHGDTHVLNPGALFRATTHTVAVVELPGMRCEFLEVTHDG